MMVKGGESSWIHPFWGVSVIDDLNGLVWERLEEGVISGYRVPDSVERIPRLCTAAGMSVAKTHFKLKVVRKYQTCGRQVGWLFGL